MAIKLPSLSVGSCVNCILDGRAKTKSYKQYLEIEIARRRNGRVHRPGLDDDNATLLKHRNESFLDYMLDSVFMGSKMNKLIGRTSHTLYCMHILHLNLRNQKNQILFQYLTDKKKKERGRGSEKKGGGVENSPISSPLDPSCCLISVNRFSATKAVNAFKSS